LGVLISLLTETRQLWRVSAFLDFFSPVTLPYSAQLGSVDPWRRVAAVGSDLLAGPDRDTEPRNDRQRSEDLERGIS
jgi:hypothetical protein